MSNDGHFFRTNVGEQLPIVEDPETGNEDFAMDQEQDEKVALALKISKLIAEHIIEQNPSNEALSRVIDGRLSAIFSSIDGIVLEEEPQVSEK